MCVCQIHMCYNFYFVGRNLTPLRSSPNILMILPESSCNKSLLLNPWFNLALQVFQIFRTCPKRIVIWSSVPGSSSVNHIYFVKIHAAFTRNHSKCTWPSDSGTISKLLCPRKLHLWWCRDILMMSQWCHDSVILIHFQIDHKELENVLSESEIRFPDNQEVWLKDLASFLNLRLEKVKDADVPFTGKPPGTSVYDCLFFLLVVLLN